jgi:hypothetical protein
MGMFNDKSCLAANKVLLVDACRNDPSDGRSGGAPKELQSITRPLVPKPPGGTVALFSCSQGEISHESQEHKRGYLFHHVIEALSGKAANQKGEVTWTALVKYVKDYLPQSVLKDKGPKVHQNPEEVSNLRGDMLLARSGARNTRDLSRKPQLTQEKNIKSDTINQLEQYMESRRRQANSIGTQKEEQAMQSKTIQNSKTGGKAPSTKAPKESMPDIWTLPESEQASKRLTAKDYRDPFARPESGQSSKRPPKRDLPNPYRQ